MIGAESGPNRAQVQDGRWLVDRELPLPETLWRDLGLSVALASVVCDPPRRRWIAVCPGPAGVTEQPLLADAWGEVALAVPLVAEVDPDREALLICGGQRHVGSDRPGDLDVFVAPLGICGRFVNALGPLWRGRDGGDRAWRVIEDFLDEIRARAKLAGATPADRDSAPAAAWWRDGRDAH